MDSPRHGKGGKGGYDANKGWPEAADLVDGTGSGGTASSLSSSSYAKIPRIIWMLWFDGWEKATELHKRCLESWQLYNPSWEVRPISRLDFQQLMGNYLPRYEKLRYSMNALEKFGGFWIPPAAESDLLRLVLLAAYGGCWVDSTMLCRRPLDDWLPDAAASGFFAFAPEDIKEQLPVMSSFLASAPRHIMVNTWLRRVESHWMLPFAEREKLDLGFFWVHKIFGTIVGGEAAKLVNKPAVGPEVPEARYAWEQVPRITGEYGKRGPHFWVKYSDTLRPPPTEAYRRTITDERETPMWKLTNHELKLADASRDSCYWVMLEDTREHARNYSTSLTTKADAPRLESGARVCLRRLEGRPDLNGKFGTLGAFVEEKGRWQVSFAEKGLGTKLFKSENLYTCEPEGESRLASVAGSDASAVERLLEIGGDVGCT